jgi:chromate transporter
MNTDADGSVLVPMLLYFALISLTAVGGGVLMLAPDVHRYAVDTHHWLTADQFVAAFAIAQAAPGPNVLYVTLVGLQVAGLTGAIGATIAVVMPTFLLTMLLVRFTPQRPAGRLSRAVKNGLAPISTGLLAGGGWVLARTADTGHTQVLLTVASVGVMMMTKLNPVWLIAIGAAVGVALQL